jgi:hypothetical protein
MGFWVAKRDYCALTAQQECVGLAALVRRTACNFVSHWSQLYSLTPALQPKSKFSNRIFGRKIKMGLRDWRDGPAFLALKWRLGTGNVYKYAKTLPNVARSVTACGKRWKGNSKKWWENM